MITEEYKKFLDRSSRLMERALTQDVDIFVDYTGELSDEGSVFVFINDALHDKSVFSLSCRRKRVALRHHL